MWLKRHVFIPLLSNKEDKYTHKAPKLSLNKFNAGLAVFLISALFHEWIIAVPTGIYHGWAFGGIFMQIPLIVISTNYDKWYRNYYRPGYKGVNTVGNMFFWLVFCVFGQPMASYLYYRKWAINHNPDLYAITREDLQQFGNGNEWITYILTLLIG